MSSMIVKEPSTESATIRQGSGRPAKRRRGHALEAWNGHDPSETDICLITISYGLLAPNPHNIQPWKIELTGPQQFDLYVDQSRLLPETDPPARQVHIGQGTFLENVDLAARHFGYRADINYFPQGMYDNSTVEDKPVASVTLVQDPTVQADPLFYQILKRQTNRRTYRRKPLTRQQIERLMVACDDCEYRLTITSDRSLLKAFTDILVDAMRIETSNRQRDMETVNMFRFNDAEVEYHRDGFGLGQMGVSGFMKWMAESFFLSRQGVLEDNTTFGKTAVKLTYQHARSAAAFGWIVSPTNTRLDQIKVGRAYERINLTATALGLVQHPMSQVEQEYPDMAPLQKKFARLLEMPPNHKVQMVFRFGHAKRVTPSPRRAIAELLRQA